MLLRIRIIFIFVIKEINIFRKVSRLFETFKWGVKVERKWVERKWVND